MTALLEFKQRLKELYGQYELYILPVLKFILAIVYFFGINQLIGFSDKLKSPFVLLVIALVCAILPANIIVWVGFALIIGNCYSLGMEAAGFAVLLIFLMAILFLRFSSRSNLIMAFTPAAFLLKIPAAVPMGGGLVGSFLTSLPAGCSVILYYFMRLLKEQAAMLQSADTEMLQKVNLIADGMIKNQEMWLTVLAFVVVAVLVNLIRTRDLDYAWRIGVVVGCVTYILIMLAGGLFLNVDVHLVNTIIFTAVAAVLGLLLEFFAFGGDYTRTEHMEYEDDEYYYYVKAVPKVSIAASKRKVKKINGDSGNPARGLEGGGTVVGFMNPAFEEKTVQVKNAEPPAPKKSINDVDFEKKLEDSLKDL